MSRRQLAAAVLGLACAGTACSAAGSGPSVVPVCVATTETAAVNVTIVDFDFEPSAMTAAVGRVIGFTNAGFESHNVTLDDGSCKTATLDHGGTAGLRFNVAGAYPVHCTIHPWLIGTITIRP